MKCLECKHVEIIESGEIKETIVRCFLCNEINGQMENCKDFEAIK